jgi:hypothetical protein
MRRIILSASVLSALVGVTLGILFPVTTSHALSAFSIQVYPGGNGYLSCGWHQTCLSPYPTGAALDFGDPTWVYFRSYGSGSSGGSLAGQGRIAYVSGDQCQHLTYVDIYDLLGNYRSEVLYEHVSSGYAGYNFWIYGGTPGSTTEYYVGQTIDEPHSPTCPFTGMHVHEQATGGGMSKNTSDYPDVSKCNSSCWLLKGNWTYWVFTKLWSY